MGGGAQIALGMLLMELYDIAPTVEDRQRFLQQHRFSDDVMLFVQSLASAQIMQNDLNRLKTESINRPDVPELPDTPKVDMDVAAVESGNSVHGDEIIGRAAEGTGGSSNAFGEMSLSDSVRYSQYWDDVANGLDTDSRVKLNQWKYRPDAELYCKHKNVYDNSHYFDQSTGNVIYPGTNGDINANGFVNGMYNEVIIQPEKVIDRYGSNGNGRYFSPEGTSFEERALPPFMEQQAYTKYEVVKPLPAKSGEIASWFDQPGGGTQYFTDMTVDELRDLGYIVPIE